MKAIHVDPKREWTIISKKFKNNFSSSQETMCAFVKDTCWTLLWSRPVGHIKDKIDLSLRLCNLRNWANEIIDAKYLCTQIGQSSCVILWVNFFYHFSEMHYCISLELRRIEIMQNYLTSSLASSSGFYCVILRWI